MNKEKKMYHYVAWFQEHYPELIEEMMSCMHNYALTELNPYHLESDCWSHTMMVCKLAELATYDKVVQIAALLHDIGKPTSRRINLRNNHVQFFGHEVLSAEMAEDILESMFLESLISIKEKEEIIQLIIHHAFLYEHSEANAMMNSFNGNRIFCIHLVELIRCDTLGRFCSDLPSEEKFISLLEEIESY